jgi:DNA-binding transcriptional LysR family regulator
VLLLGIRASGRILTITRAERLIQSRLPILPIDGADPAAMHFRGLDLNLLVVLDALLTEKSTTRAGERIYLSQSAVSGALARLREFFSDELLVQVGHKMVLTPLAEELATPIRESLLSVEAIVNKDTVFNPATSTRRFRIMLSDYAVTVLINTALPLVSAAAPGVQLEFLSHSDNPATTLEQGDVDLLLIARQYSSAVHPNEDLFQDEYTCVVWTQNKMIGDTLSMDHYLEMGHVVTRFGKTQRPSAEEDFINQRGIIRKTEVVAMNFTMVPQLLIGTNRIATMHRRLAEIYSRLLPIRLLPPPIELPPLVEAMQWHKIRSKDRGICWLRGMLKNGF